MTREWLAQEASIIWPALALFLFIGLFIGVLIWIYRPGSKRLYEREANLPLEDGTAQPKDDASSSREEKHGEGT